MAQNTSYAVMSQRSEPHDSLDDFPTPPWAARALCLHVINISDDATVLEPACGRGYLLRGLLPYFIHDFSADVHNYGENKVEDFLIKPYDRDWIVDWIITNPPFRLAEQFIDRALDIANVGVAMLVRTQFLEGIGRHKRLFTERAPHIIAQFAERVPMAKGRCLKTTVTATAYCWLVWRGSNAVGETKFIWIPPCRKQLEMPGDYD